MLAAVITAALAASGWMRIVASRISILMMLRRQDAVAVIGRLLLQPRRDLSRAHTAWMLGRPVVGLSGCGRCSPS